MLPDERLVQLRRLLHHSRPQGRLCLLHLLYRDSLKQTLELRLPRGQGQQFFPAAGAADAEHQVQNFFVVALGGNEGGPQGVGDPVLGLEVVHFDVPAEEADEMFLEIVEDAFPPLEGGRGLDGHGGGGFDDFREWEGQLGKHLLNGGFAIME